MITLRNPLVKFMVGVGMLHCLWVSLPDHPVMARYDHVSLSTRSTKEPVRRALLVGINLYQPATLPTAIAQRGKNRGIWGNLNGPLNDVDGMREILIARFGFQAENIRVLKNTEARREQIFRAIQEHLINKAEAGDVSFFFYAGHGSQVFNSKSPEADKLDESLVPADSAQGAADIRDKELARLWNQALEKKILLTVIADSCHSGSIQRGGYPRTETVRQLEPNWEDAQDPSLPAKPEERGAIILSASRADQPATEREDERGITRGLFSAALLKTLQTVSVNESVERVYLRVKALMQSQGSPQEPMLATNEGKRPFFGSVAETTAGLTTVAVLQVRKDKKPGEKNIRVELQGGYAVGLNEGCELRHSNLSIKPSVRLRVTELLGLNRCVADVVSGDASVIREGDLFEVDTWAAAKEAILRVWLPPATLKHAELLQMAQMLAPLRTSDRIVWVNDPAEASPSDAPLYVLTWSGTQWHLLSSQGQPFPLGLKPTAQTVLQMLSSIEKRKPALLLNVPPSRELRAAIQLGEKTVKHAVQIVTTPAKANYYLMGRWQGEKFEYAWVLPNVTKDQAQSLPLPLRTDWQDSSQPTRASQQLMELISRASKVKAWLQLDAPPERTPFPYRLALKNKKTGEIKTSGKTVEDEEYDLVLQADREQLGNGPVKPRYVYAFVIDSYGKGDLLFPLNTVENLIPYKIAGQPASIAQTEYVLPESGFQVGMPLGMDTFFLLTSYDAIPNLEAALNFEAVRTRTGLTPLEKLLSDNGAMRREVTRVPTDWSLQRISFKSVSKAESGKLQP